MRSYRYLVSSLALIALCLHPTVALKYPLDARRNGQTSSSFPVLSETTASQASSTGDASTLPSSTSGKAVSTSADPEPSSAPTSSADSSSLSISVTPTASIQAPSTSVANVPVASATNGMASTTRSLLPIQPTITPAIGLAGVILLLSGIVYTMIGIKNKMLYIFSSACYLTSLAITVLIVYLMSPPVSNAIQGAFFVAALISGLIFGALSLVFADITDGLGCLLGGYCLSMWFLTLKEGGLIESTTGRAIFIALMSFAGFSLSFSHYTRTYGLIVSISFAGATITVLGIDCLSRAGLKEFWLYLWNLNSNTFPLNTNTYPVTRGIRVEAAFIVLIFLLGIVSQLKLWKLVKERRERGAITRLEREENQQREEEERGRRIENDFARERAEWEAQYGDKSMAGRHTDSGIGSSNNSNPKTSVSVNEMRRSDSVEMVDMSRSKEIDQTKLMSRDNSKRGSGAAVVTVRVLQDNHVRQIDSDGNTIPNSPNPTTARNSGFNSSANSSARVSAELRPVEEGDEARLVSTRTSLRSSVPPPPIVVPLPFTVPTSEDADHEDHASVSTVPESLPTKRPGSKRFSALSNRLSMNRVSSDHSTSKEVLIPHIEDDRASSVAATMDDMDDDDFSLPELSPPHSPLKLGFEEQIDAHIEATTLGEDDEKSPEAPALAAPVSNQPEEETTTKSPNRQSLTTSTDPKPNDTKPKRASIGSQRRRSGASVVNEEEGRTSRRSKSMQSIPQSEGSQGESHIGSFAEVLPEKLSKIVLSYRTNEWAKHLEVADKPDLDELQQPPSPGVQVHMGLPEATTPPKVVENQPLPVSNLPISNTQAPTPQLARQSSQASLQASNTNPYRQPNATQSSSTMSRYSLNESTSVSLSRTPSSVTVNSIPGIQIPGQYSGGSNGAPRSSSAAKMRGGRNSSMPLMNQTLVESPIEEESANMRFGPSPVPGNNLMGRREALVRNNTAQTSFTPYSSVPNLNVISASDAGSTRVMNLHTADSDNLSLSERKKLIDQENMALAQRQTLIQMQPQQRRQGTWPLAEQMQGFDSHQPQRTSTIDNGKREARLATWRESIRKETAPAQVPVVSEEDRRMAMIQERRQQEMEKQQQAMAANVRDTMFDNMMRRGDMLDAHKEALRRMQASANKNA